MRTDIPKDPPGEAARARRMARDRALHAEGVRLHAWRMTSDAADLATTGLSPEIKAEAHRLAWQAHMAAAFVQGQLGKPLTQSERVAQSEVHFKETPQYRHSMGLP